MKMNYQNVTKALGLTCALFLAALPTLACASDKGISASGIAYISGGVGDEEIASLKDGRANYSLWLVTAALGSGAYLADTVVKISDEKNGNVIFENTMAGPWLFVALPNGRYAINATYPLGRGGKPETQRTTATVGTGDHHQAVLYFDSGDKVGDPVVDKKVAK